MNTSITVKKNTVRLIKKKNKRLMNLLKVEEYNWKSLKQDSYIYPDNIRHSTVLTKTHDPQEIEKGISPKSFDSPLAPKTVYLTPQDLTQDFVISQKEITVRKRRSMLDDDEAAALELADVNIREEVFGPGSWENNDKEIQEKVDTLNKQREGESQIPRSDQEVSPLEGTPGQEEVSASPDLAAQVSESSVVSGDESSDTASPDSPFEAQEREETDQEPEPQQFNESLPPASDSSEAQEPTSSAPSPEETEPEKTEAENPVNAKQDEEEESPQSLREDEGDDNDFPSQFAGGYSKGFDQGLEKGEEKGFSQGFEKGKEEGIQKGLEEGREENERQFSEYVAKIEKSLQEVSEAKQEALESGKGIFLEMVKILGEKVIQSQLKFSGEQLEKYYTEAVKGLLHEDNESVKVSLSSEDYQKVGDALKKIKGVTVNEKKDIEPGNFVVDNGREVSVSQLKDKVGTMVDELSSEIFKKE